MEQLYLAEEVETSEDGPQHRDDFENRQPEGLPRQGSNELSSSSTSDGGA
jgi:hypothetical protein